MARLTDNNIPLTIFWFRRDLRLEDNHGLYKALKQSSPVLPIFIFDSAILTKLVDKKDKRVAFIHEKVAEIARELEKWQSTLYVAHGEPLAVFRQLLETFPIAQVIANEDFEPYAVQRDNQIRDLLGTHGIPFQCFKDQVTFNPAEILKSDSTPYVVFTPYSKEWKRRLEEQPFAAYPSETHLHRLWKHSPNALPSLKDLGFQKVQHGVPPILLQKEIINNYAATRNIPHIQGTSQASPHLRFGTVSVRHLVSMALQWNETWLNELIWREFFMMILYHFPRVINHSFRPRYDAIEWQNNETEFHAWCHGNTGFPLVDAGMRQLNATGTMHNRVRMVVASFLTKHLLIDWRWGEAYFAQKLLDYELASNNGNWQWAAGCGCDAAPYFRIFNPIEQARKFDPDSAFIKTWIPGFPSGYHEPIIDHAFARNRALTTYKVAVG